MKEAGTGDFLKGTTPIVFGMVIVSRRVRGNPLWSVNISHQEL